MNGWGRQFSVVARLLAAFGFAFFISILPGRLTVAGESPLSFAVQKSGTEVTLMNVYFRNPRMGWAVGSGGTVLKTLDGGGKWKKVSSGTTAMLTGVLFIDDKHGWLGGTNGALCHGADGGG